MEKIKSKRSIIAMTIVYFVAMICTLSACGTSTSEGGGNNSQSKIQDVSKYTNLTFSVADETAKTMTVKAASTNVTNIDIPEKVKYNGAEYTVTEIEIDAFGDCASLTIVVVPKSITKIGDNAFEGCESLTAINVDTNNTAYTSIDGVLYNKDKTNLILYPAGKTSTTYTILSSVTDIDSNAFDSFSTLTEINVEDSNSMYSSIDGVLFNKNKTTLITYPAGKTDTSYTIPEGVTTIGDKAFNGCTNLKTLTMPNSITNVGDLSFNCVGLETLNVAKADYLTYFANCTNIKNLSVDAGTIPANAFKNSDKLTTVVLGDGVTSVGESAFDSCSSLQSVSIGSNVTSLGTGSFANCSALKTLSILGDPTLDSSVFANCINIENLSLYKADSYSYFSNCPNIKTLSFVSGEIGESAFKDNTKLTSISLGSKMTTIGVSAFSGCTSLSSVEIEEGLTTISARAFEDCTAIKTLSIPKSVETIATNSFEGCENVEDLTLGNSEFAASIYQDLRKIKTLTVLSGDKGLYYLYNLYYLTSVVLGDEVTAIDRYALYGCKALETVTIGKGVTTIGNGVFSYCEALTTINVDSENTAFKSVDNVLFDKNMKTLVLYPIGRVGATYAIPSGVTTISDNACAYAKNLTSVNLPEGLTTIGKEAFYLAQLTSIDVPKSVTSIGEEAFHCTTMTAINVDDDNTTYTSVDGVLFNKTMTTLIKFPIGKDSSAYSIQTSVTSIGKLAFNSNSKLTTIVIPNGVTTIGEKAFYQCSALTAITIPSTITSMGNYAFTKCAALKSVTMENGVTVIGLGAFDQCSSLTSITIPNSVTSIGGYAFYKCSSLTSITISNSITSIGESAFSGCLSLTSITIPNSVICIGTYAFYECSNLTSITFANTTGWNLTSSADDQYGIKVDVSNPTSNATNLTSDHSWYWFYLHRVS